MTDIKAGISKLLLEEYNIDKDITCQLFDRGILNYKECRDLLIRTEYSKKAEPKERNFLKSKLAERYCISMSLVEKVVLKQPSLQQI